MKVRLGEGIVLLRGFPLRTATGIDDDIWRENVKRYDFKMAVILA